MDIKSIIRNVIPFGASAVKDPARTRAKTDADNDREGNGQASGEERKRHKPTPEEVQEALRFLEGLSGIKENGLTVRTECKEDCVVVYVEDRDGKVVRRIPEQDLIGLASNPERKSGHLINKAM